MKTSFIYAVLFTLSSTAIIAPSYASTSIHDSNVPHIYGNTQFPRARWGNITHTFRLHVPQNSKAVSQLTIKVPENVTLSKDVSTNINVVNENGQKINTNVSVNGKTIVLAFTEPVTPNTKFNVDLKNLKRRSFSENSVYSFSVQEVGLNGEIPLGTAWFPLY
ncbi:DUF2808 domain-containing protein (plasmid) [Tolypothrix sp. PCC 7910]|uniref:DUF2808 domain-containing protein n=1 Tax=Tolypothrix sp. PCC 7910 TaxID=2099387 RepID=UPI0014278E63|nr:DUF2808 domain-containing protein [Tolypothrix sp. PCC 7910]QIR41821.1 DUF2808 domain-containing protein [Tolypothrix sp. PCC 7910]